MLTGCQASDDKLLATFVPPDLLLKATNIEAEYLPLEEGYFYIANFDLPANESADWLAEDYKEGDCEYFKSLQGGGYIDEQWLDRMEKAKCYRNATVTDTDLATYNEISVLLYEDKILLYAAGLNEEVTEE